MRKELRYLIQTGSILAALMGGYLLLIVLPERVASEREAWVQEIIQHYDVKGSEMQK